MACVNIMKKPDVEKNEIKVILSPPAIRGNKGIILMSYLLYIKILKIECRHAVY